MKIFTKKIIIISGIFFLTFPIFSQEQNAKKLSIEDVVELALQNNISVKQSKMDLDLAAKKNKYSWNSISPSLSLSGGLNGSSKDFLKDDSASSMGMQSNQGSLSWSASGSLSMNFAPALATSIKGAKLSYEAGELSYETAKRDIILSVSKTFYSLVYFNENLELQERNLQTAKQTYESNKTKFSQGRLSELQLLNSQYNYESRIPTVENLKTTYQSNLDNFKLVLGLDISENIELDGSLLDLDSFVLSDEILNFDINEIPSIKTMQKSIESSENSLTATKYSAYGPSVSLSGGVSSSAGIDPSSDPRLTLSYGVSLRIPLDGYLPWSSNALNIDTQKESLEKAKQKLEQTKLSTELSIRNSYNTILQAEVQLKLSEKNVELMQRTYDMTLASYSVGSVDLLSLQTAENNLYQAKYNVQDQRYKIISQIFDLENLLGKSLRSK